MHGELNWQALETVLAYTGAMDYDACIDQILAIIRYQNEIREIEQQNAKDHR